MYSTTNHALLRERRLKANLTIKQLANRLKMFPSQVSDIERGKGQVAATKVLPYCQALDIHPEELFVWVESNLSDN